MAVGTAIDLIELLEKSGLLTRHQVEAAFHDEPPTDPAELANALVQRELLTAYQAKQLLAGKARGFFLGPYKILRPLGKGGMGVVFLAEHRSLGRRVALKVLGAEHAKDRLALDRFLREARAAAALDHPHIVKLYYLSEGGAVHYLAMELVDGTDLQTLLGQTGPLHHAQAAEYVAQAAAGLAHAHEKGFVHRDIKPANLMVARDGTVKILDMGLARSLNSGTDNLTAVQAAGEIAGTVDFLSPEQAMNQPLDERSDLYSLGATFYSLVTGHPPYSGTTAQKLAQHQLREPPDASKKLNGRVPEALAAVICKMMAKNKSERYQTAADVIDALGPWLPVASTGNVARGPLTRATLGKAVRPPAVSPRRKYLLAGGGGAAVLAAVLAAVALSGGSPRPAPAGPQAVSYPNTPPSAAPTTAPPAADGRFQPLPLGAAATASAAGPLFVGKPIDKFLFARGGIQEVRGVPFDLPGPQAADANIVALHSSSAPATTRLPRAVTVPVGRPVRAFHVLGGVSAWGWTRNQPGRNLPAGTPSVIVRLRYADQTTEEHVWKNGEHLADFFGRHDVPGSEFALMAGEAQVRHLTVRPAHPDKTVESVEFLKAEEDDKTCPVVLAVTAESAVSAPPPVRSPSPPSFAARGRFQPVPFGEAANSSAAGPLFAGHPGDALPFAPAGERTVRDVPFVLPDPADRGNNILTLFGPNSEPTRQLPRSARVAVGGPVRALHFLSGVSAWGWPFSGPDGTEAGVVSLVVRLEYADGATEDHEWANGEQFADYGSRHDVPGSEFALLARNGKQVRYLTLVPRRPDQVVAAVEFTKGPDDRTSPAVVAITVERPEAGRPAPPAAPPTSKAGPMGFIPLDFGPAAAVAVTAPPPGGRWGTHPVGGVPFDCKSPAAGRPNAVRLGGAATRLPCFLAARAVHLLGHGPAAAAATVQARFHYADGKSEPAQFKPGRGEGLLTATPTRPDPIAEIEFGPAAGGVEAVLAVTVET